LTTKKTQTQEQQQAEELAPWEVPPVEGETTVATGAEVEPAEVMATIQADDTLQNLMDWCVSYMEDHAADNSEVMAAEVRRILAGEDAEAVLSESAPLNGKQHTEKPFLLRGFNLNPGDFEDGWPFYASMTCEIPGTGDNFTMNCGGIKVIAALRRLHELGEYPYAVKVRGKNTKAGYTVLSLVMAGA
jgi:hypothetical protein